MLNHIVVFLKSHIGWDALLALILAFLALWVTGMVSKFCDWIKSYHPIKIKGSELAWWHIERESSPNGFIPHCHEYNFAGTLSLIPRAEVIINEVNLKIPVGNKYQTVPCISGPANEHLWLNPDTQRTEYKNIINDVFDKSITDNFSFQTRLENTIKIPQFAYVIVKHNRGVIKLKIALKENKLMGDKA